MQDAVEREEALREYFERLAGLMREKQQPKPEEARTLMERLTASSAPTPDGHER